jgi:hypothetical protein
MKTKMIIMCLLLTGCAGFSRSCSSFNAESFGANWVIAQYTNSGEMFRCWKLDNTSVTNEEGSDGIYWKAQGGHLVHISGWYNRVQVENSDFAGAASEIDIDINKCK